MIIKKFLRPLRPFIPQLVLNTLKKKQGKIQLNKWNKKRLSQSLLLIL